MTFPEEEWTEIIDTNLTGTLRACQIFAKSMFDRGYGGIINFASLDSFVALSEVAAYAASKAGVVSRSRVPSPSSGQRKAWLFNTIASMYPAPDLNSVFLDGTPRGQELLMRTPMGRFGRTEELVGSAVFLASDAASFITGHTIVVDGGFLASGVNQ